jgi:hypothetical protein
MIRVACWDRLAAVNSAEALEGAIAGHVAAIRDAALSSPAGGGDRWDAMLRHYGIAPLEAHERAMIVEALRLPRGAAPAEVRMAFAGLEAWANGALTNVAPDAAADRVRGSLTGLADRETQRYERDLGLAPPPAPRAAPPPPTAPSLGSIFQNAQQTSKEVPWAGVQYKQVATLTCVHCGGPQEQPLDFICRYCRRPIAGAPKPLR